MKCSNIRIMANDIDQASADVILALQLQDIQTVRYSSVGEEDADLALALQAYQDELERSASTLRDYRVATLLEEIPQQLPPVPPAVMPIADAIEPPNRPLPYITNSQDATEQHNIQPMGPTTSNDSPSWTSNIFGEPHGDSEGSTTNPNLIARAGLFLLDAFRQRPWGDTPHVDDGSESQDLRSDPEEHHSLNAHSDASSESLEPSLSCSICRYEISPEHSFLLSCQDRYCDECIICLFNAAMKHESLFPPQCCGEQVPLATVQHLITAEIELAFQMRRVELATPNRVYCSKTDCSAFIEPWYHVGDTATCPKCYSHTCITCKGPKHENQCPLNPAAIDLMALAASQGYKQCPSCHTMIEFIQGCNHMTFVCHPLPQMFDYSGLTRSFTNIIRSRCRCGQQFCWECGAKWKSCTCPAAHINRVIAPDASLLPRDEEPNDLEAHRLEARRQAAQRQETQRQEIQLRETQRQAARDREFQRLERQARCRHDRTYWEQSRREGQLDCGTCGMEQRAFVYECPACRLRECAACRNARRGRHKLREFWALVNRRSG